MLLLLELLLQPAEDSRIELCSDGNCRCKRRHDKRHGDDEPRHGGEIDSAEEVEEEDDRETKDRLDRKGDPHTKRRIKAQLDHQEDKIEKRRGAKVFDKPHLYESERNRQMELIMTLAGVSQEVAERALLEHETVEAALDALIQKPTVSGDKYIPAKPVVKTGVDPEQEERCRKGRS